jgi:Protein of unknown function (DUF1501)
MLSVFDGNQPLSRRQMLTIGGLGLGGLSLPSLLAAGESSPAHVTGKSVIFLFQQGGPSQFETFDPKPLVPPGIRTVTGLTQTSLPGVFFGDTMARLSRLADKFGVVRSFQTNNAGHNIRPLVGPESLETNIGVHYARVVGTTRPGSGMPTNAVLFPQAVDASVTKGKARGNLAATGSYGDGFGPFIPGGKGQLQKDMQLSLPHDRFFNDRRELLRKLDGLNRRFDRAGEAETLGEIRRQAFELLLSGGVADALDLSKENPKTVAKYDTSRFAKPGRWDKVNRGKRGFYHGHEKTIGRLLLLSRRLCEAGCGFVTVHAGYDGVWDMHADRNNLNMVDGMRAVGPAFDHAVAAFIEDVEARGLRDKILLVCCGEMGRTPRINKRGGRDHWGKLASLLIYGGGTKPGQIIGRSDRAGSEPATDRLGPNHLISTILRTVFDLGRLRITPGIPSPVLKLAAAKPIPGLV